MFNISPFISVTSYISSLVILLLILNVCLIDIVPDSGVRRRIQVISAVPYLIIGLFPVFGALLPDSDIKFLLQGLGNIWLGFYVYFFGISLILFILRAAAWFFLRVFKGREEIRARGRIRVVSGLILGGAFLTAMSLQIYGMIHAQHPKLVSYDVHIDKEAGGLKEMKLVLIADLHMSVNSKQETIQKMVDMVNEQDADAVVIAGDIFTSSYGGMKDPAGYAGILRGMRTKYGVYAVYGNHDVEETLFGGFPISPISQAFRTAEMEQFFQDAGFTVLCDETVTLGEDVQLAGRVDGEKAGDGTDERMRAAELLKDVDQEKPVIVLEHEPVDFRALKEHGADLALCGHTHAGQIFPGNLVVPFFNENAYGYKVVSGLQTIVTAGVGYYGPPMRVGTDSEVTVVNLTFGKSEN